jgi:hypothetical protein
MDPRIRIRTKSVWFRNTALQYVFCIFLLCHPHKLALGSEKRIITGLAGPLALTAKAGNSGSTETTPPPPLPSSPTHILLTRTVLYPAPSPLLTCRFSSVLSCSQFWIGNIFYADQDPDSTFYFYADLDPESVPHPSLKLDPVNTGY